MRSRPQSGREHASPQALCRPLPRGRDCISHPWFSSKCYTRLGACTRAPERPCLCGVYGLVQVTGSKQMTHKYIYDHEMRQGPGMRDSNMSSGSSWQKGPECNLGTHKEVRK